MKRAFGGATILRRTVMADRPVAMYLGQLKNFAGEPVAVVELVKDISTFVDSETSTRWYLIGATSAVVLAAILIALFVARTMSKPTGHSLAESQGKTAVEHGVMTRRKTEIVLCQSIAP